MKRQHPLRLLPFIGKYLFLLLLPLFRGLLTVRDPKGLESWLRGSWFDIVIILLILAFAYFSWRCSRIRIENDVLTVHNGWFFHRESTVSLHEVTTLSVETPFYLRPFRAKRVLIDTAGGVWHNPDFSLLLYAEDADTLLASRVSNVTSSHRYYRAKLRYLLFLSFCVSNSFTGILVSVAFFDQSGRILGAEFQQRLLSGLDTVAAPLRFLPHTAAITALLLLIGWGVYFSRNLLHYIGFCVTRQKDVLHIHNGFLSKREYTCPIGAINYLDFRQTVLGKILRLYTVFIHCIGYGKRKNDKAVLLPAAGAAAARRVTEQLLAEFPREAVTVRPGKYALWRYVRWPLLLFIGIPFAVYILALFIADFTELVHFIGTMLCVPILWWLILKVLDRNTAGIGETPHCLTVCYAQKLTLHTVVIPKNRISFIRLRQTVFQKRRDVCDVFLYTHDERRRRHHIRQLPKKDVQKLLNV